MWGCELNIAETKKYAISSIAITPTMYMKALFAQKGGSCMFSSMQRTKQP
jgi:hypothetical protein